MEEVEASLSRAVNRYFPRLLTQACRDPNAPFFGCFDRNWWHYKTRDFPSIILQQGGYTAHLAGKLAEFSELSSGLNALASASVSFWCKRALRHGAFEEYYPWEQGYPPLAFSTLSVAKLCLSGVCDTEAAMPGLEIAAHQLIRRFEKRAANQQVAGLAALSCLRIIAPKLVSDDVFDSLTDRTLALQEQEGWFREYDGPDLGYLTVTLDCLWDLFDQTGNPEFVAAASRAFAFVEWFVSSPPHGAGLHNARNTDYLVPYGLTRFLAQGAESAGRVTTLLRRLYRDTDSPTHFLAAVDDRYITHYIGHSVVRAVLRLRDLQTCNPDVSAEAAPLATEIRSRYLAGSGHWRGPQSILVSGKKGGIFTLSMPGGRTISDFGWIVRRTRRDFVSHWWSQDWIVDARDAEISIRGVMYAHVEHLSTPSKHFALRLLSFFLGSRLIAWLKSLLIFKGGGPGLRFHRSIVFTDDGQVCVEDEIEGLLTGDEVTRAPRASKRHVASADSFHPEDFLLAHAGTFVENRTRSGNTLRIHTTHTVRD